MSEMKPTGAVSSSSTVLAHLVLLVDVRFSFAQRLDFCEIALVRGDHQRGVAELNEAHKRASVQASVGEQISRSARVALAANKQRATMTIRMQ